MKRIFNIFLLIVFIFLPSLMFSQQINFTMSDDLYYEDHIEISWEEVPENFDLQILHEGNVINEIKDVTGLLGSYIYSPGSNFILHKKISVRALIDGEIAGIKEDIQICDKFN